MVQFLTLQLNMQKISSYRRPKRPRGHHTAFPVVQDLFLLKLSHCKAMTARSNCHCSDYCEVTLRRKTEEDSVATDKCCSSCALPEEKAVPGIKAGFYHIHGAQDQHLGKEVAMGESDAAPQTASLGTDSSPRAPQSLLRSEEVVQDSRGNPPSQLEE